MSVLTVGETMVLLDPLDDELPHAGQRLQLRIGGAEPNLAVALSRLGASVMWVSRLGADPFGDVIESTLLEEGVEVVAPRDTSAPTGLFYKWREDGRSHNIYYRQGSAACSPPPISLTSSWRAPTWCISRESRLRSAPARGPW